MSPRFVLGGKTWHASQEVVNRSLKADCTDVTRTLCSYIFVPKPERVLGNRSYLSACICFILYKNEAKLRVLTGNALLIAMRKRKIQVQRLDFAIWHLPSK